jgi:hypothetical protein
MKAEDKHGSYNVFFPVAQQAKWGLGRLCFEVRRSHSHTTLGRTPLDERSARRRDFYLTTHKHSQETNIHAHGGIRTHDPSKRSAEGARLGLRVYWDRQGYNIVSDIFV